MVFWKLWKQILTWAQTESFDISKNSENNHDIEFYLVCSQPLLFFFSYVYEERHSLHLVVFTTFNPVHFLFWTCPQQSKEKIKVYERAELNLQLILN